jgi:hypothetical protein
MGALKQTALTAMAGVLVCSPLTPAVAAGPLLFAPLILGGRLIGAATRLATLPLIAASAAVSVPAPPAAYAAAGGYYAPPIYYPRAPQYYGAPQAYYPAAGPNAYSAPRYYPPSQRYYAPAPRYSGYYGAQAAYGSRGYSYRRR